MGRRKRKLKDIQAEKSLPRKSRRKAVPSPMVTDTCTTTLDDLPRELLDLVFQHLEPSTLRKACCVSRKWQGLAAKYMFRCVSLLPTESGIRFWKAFLKEKPVHEWTKQVTIYSAPIPNYVPKPTSSFVIEDGYWEMCQWKPKPGTKKYFDFYSGIGSLCRFAGLTHAVLHFTTNCESSTTHRLCTGIETSEFRHDILQRFFKALKLRQRLPEAQKLRNLTIWNLQNMPLPQLTSSKLFTQTMKDIEDLHLFVAEAVDPEWIDEVIGQAERRTFMPYLQEHWLLPVSSRLRSLTLFFQSMWGPMPGYFSGDNLHFNQLHTLTLGRYCLAHDDSLDWILRQKTITSLTFHNCMIVSYIRLEADQIAAWNTPTHDWIPYSPPKWGPEMPSFHYPGTWKDAFDQIRTQLLHLLDFGFHIKPVKALLDTSVESGTSLSPGRYTVFDMLEETGWGWGPWMTATESGDLEFDEALPENHPRRNNPEYAGPPDVNRHSMTLREDGGALEELLKTVAARCGHRT